MLKIRCESVKKVLMGNPICHSRTIVTRVSPNTFWQNANLTRDWVVEGEIGFAMGEE